MLKEIHHGIEEPSTGERAHVRTKTSLRTSVKATKDTGQTLSTQQSHSPTAVRRPSMTSEEANGVGDQSLRKDSWPTCVNTVEPQEPRRKSRFTISARSKTWIHTLVATSLHGSKSWQHASGKHWCSV